MESPAPAAASPPRRVHYYDLDRTRETLVEKLRNWTDEATWQEFFRLYGPLIYEQALRDGLNDADAKGCASGDSACGCGTSDTFTTSLTSIRSGVGCIASPIRRLWIWCGGAREGPGASGGGSALGECRRCRADCRSGSKPRERMGRSRLGREDGGYCQGGNDQQGRSHGIANSFPIFVCFKEVKPKAAARLMRVSRAAVYLATFRIRRVFQKELKREGSRQSTRPNPLAEILNRC